MGSAEALPFKNNQFDLSLMVTTICFVDDAEKSLGEARRILKDRGVFIIGFIDMESNLGREYLNKKDKSLFYKEASFYSTGEILSLLKKAGFSDFSIRQTIFKEHETGSVQPVKNGCGEGSFIAIRAIKLTKH